MNTIQKIISKLFRINTEEYQKVGTEIDIIRHELDEARLDIKEKSKTIALYSERIEELNQRIKERDLRVLDYQKMLDEKTKLMEIYHQENLRLLKEYKETKTTPEKGLVEGLGFRKAQILEYFKDHELAKAKDLLVATGLTSRSQIWKIVNELANEGYLETTGEKNQIIITRTAKVKETQLPGHP